MLPTLGSEIHHHRSLRHYTPGSPRLASWRWTTGSVSDFFTSALSWSSRGPAFQCCWRFFFWLWEGGQYLANWERAVWFQSQSEFMNIHTFLSVLSLFGPYWSPRISVADSDFNYYHWTWSNTLLTPSGTNHVSFLRYDWLYDTFFDWRGGCNAALVAISFLYVPSLAKTSFFFSFSHII